MTHKYSSFVAIFSEYSDPSRATRVKSPSVGICKLK